MKTIDIEMNDVGEKNIVTIPNDVGEKNIVTIPIDKILFIKEYKESCRIYLIGGDYIPTKSTRQEVKDLIAATYGAEDEED